MPGRAAGYLRVSNMEDDKESPDDYKRQIQQACDRADLELVEVFEDLDVSGGVPPRDRPEFGRYWERRKEFDALVIPNLTRFSRDTADATAMTKVLRKEDIPLVVWDFPVDTSTAAGRFSQNSQFAAAEFQRGIAAENWKTTLERIARKGRVTSAVHTPYGYLYDGITAHNLIPDPDYAEVIPEVFNRFNRGESARSIALDLNKRGIPVIRRYRKRVRDENGDERIETLEIRTHQKVSNRWWAATVLRILDQPMYVGERLYKGELISGAWEPLIDRRVWEKTRVLRSDGKKKAPNKGKHKPEYLLGGLIVCGGCWANLHHVAEHANGKYRRPEMYNCQALRSRESVRCMAGGVSAKRAHAFVWQQVIEKVRWGVLQRSLQELRGEKSTRATGTSFEDRLAEVDRKMERLVAMAVDAPGKGAQQAFRKKAEALEEERRLLEEELRREQVREGERSSQADYVEAFMQQLALTIPELWDEDTEYDKLGNFKDPDVQQRFEEAGWSAWLKQTPVSEQKEILGTLIQHVVVEPPPHSVKKKGHRKSMHIEWADWLSVDGV